MRLRTAASASASPRVAREAHGEALLQPDDAVALDELVGQEHDLRLVHVLPRVSGKLHVPAHDGGHARVAQPLEQVGAGVRVPRLRAGDVVQQRAREHERLAQVLPALVQGGGERRRHRRHRARVRDARLRQAVLREQPEAARLVGQALARRPFADAGEVLRRVRVEQHAGIVDLDDRRVARRGP